VIESNEARSLKRLARTSVAIRPPNKRHKPRGDGGEVLLDAGDEGVQARQTDGSGPGEPSGKR
jgi:hypothetical protein